MSTSRPQKLLDQLTYLGVKFNRKIAGRRFESVGVYRVSMPITGLQAPGRIDHMTCDADNRRTALHLKSSAERATLGLTIEYSSGSNTMNFYRSLRHLELTLISVEYSMGRFKYAKALFEEKADLKDLDRLVYLLENANRELLVAIRERKQKFIPTEPPHSSVPSVAEANSTRVTHANSNRHKNSANNNHWTASAPGDDSVCDP